jgi:hypothetical protein
MNKDIFEHPHAKIVKERLMKMMHAMQEELRYARIAYVNGDPTKAPSCPRERHALRYLIDGCEIGPVYLKFELQGKLPLVRKIPLPNLTEVGPAIAKTRPFFGKHGHEYYKWNNQVSNLQISSLYTHLVEAIRDLEPYCVFRSHSFIPHTPINNLGDLKVAFVLRDEVNENNDYDFLAELRIDCSAQAENIYQRHLSYLARKAVFVE